VSWSYHCNDHQYHDIPYPGITGKHQLNNAASAICAVNCLESILPVNEDKIISAITNTSLAGRFEMVSEQPCIYLDVGHNPASSRVLRQILDGLCLEGRFIGVLALQKNREISPFIRPLIDVFSIWHVADMANSMGHSAECLANVIREDDPGGEVHEHVRIADAVNRALQDAGANDCIIILGHFIQLAKQGLHCMYNGLIDRREFLRWITVCAYYTWPGD